MFSPTPSQYIDWDTTKLHGVTFQKATILAIVASTGMYGKQERCIQGFYGDTWGKVATCKT